MYMQRVGDIRCYKHGITRQYLNIDTSVRCYVYRGKRKGWVEIDPAVAIDIAYKGIETLGETRESKYDAAYRNRKYTALSARGYRLITLTAC